MQLAAAMKAGAQKSSSNNTEESQRSGGPAPKKSLGIFNRGMTNSNSLGSLAKDSNSQRES